MAYRFRLESVLNYRRNLEEVAQQKLAREQVLLDGYQEQLARLEAELVQLVEDLEQRKQRPMAAPLYSLYMQAIDRKERTIVRQRQVVAAQVHAVEKARHELAERVKERKVMEKARERDREKYTQGVMQQEQKASDEQMVLRFNRHGSRLPR